MEFDETLGKGWSMDKQEAINFLLGYRIVSTFSLPLHYIEYLRTAQLGSIKCFSSKDCLRLISKCKQVH